MPPLKAPQENPFSPCPSLWWLLAVLALEQPHFTLCLHCPGACDPLSPLDLCSNIHLLLLQINLSHHVHRVSDAIQPSHPLSSPLLLPSSFPSIRVFSKESVLRIGWPKHWSFTFSISPSNEHSGLISFRMGWLDLLAVQGTLKSLLQHHCSEASILWLSAFFMVQLSHPYMTTGKAIALTRWTFVSKVMSLILICCLSWS